MILVLGTYQCYSASIRNTMTVG